MHANLISFKWVNHTAMSFLSTECDGSSKFNRGTHTDKSMQRCLWTHTHTDTRTHPHTNDKVRPLWVRTRMPYVCTYVCVFARISVWDSTQQMLHLFIDIKLKFTKLETEAVQPQLRTSTSPSQTPSQHWAYLIVGSVIKSHFDHKIVHCVYPLQVAPPFMILLLLLLFLLFSCMLMKQLIYHTSSLPPPVVSQRRLILRISWKRDMEIERERENNRIFSK